MDLLEELKLLVNKQENCQCDGRREADRIKGSVEKLGGVWNMGGTPYRIILLAKSKTFSITKFTTGVQVEKPKLGWGELT